MNRGFWFSSTAEFIPPLVCSIGDDAGSGNTGGGGSGPPASPSSDSSSGTGSVQSPGLSSAPSPDSGTSPSTGTTPPASSSSPSSSDFDFGSIFGEPAPAAGSVKEPAAATAPAPAKTEPQPAPATAAKPVEGQPPAPAQPAPTQAPVTSDQGTQPQPQYDLNDPASMSQALGQMQDAAVDNVAKTLFALSPKDIEGLETNAAETIPRLLARVFVVSQTQYLQQMARMVPAMMAKQTAAQEAYRKNGEAFFKAWPQLNEAQHGDVIRRVGQVWRAQNPNATLEQAIAEIGPMAMMIAKVQPAAPAAPQAARPNGRSSPAFTPAVSGVVSGAEPAAANPFEFLGQQQ